MTPCNKTLEIGQVNMTEEQELDSVENDKNWKALREENKALKEKVTVFEAQAKDSVFKEAGLDTSQGIGKAISQVYKGDLEIESLRTFASEEYGVTFEEVGQQDGIREEVQESQNKLDTITRESVVDTFGDNIIDAINSSDNPKDSIRLKLAAMDEAKENSR
tara:strand:+ start:735 stop:1220 length:486 start_codon:yes stop_codon:yes gene_type:complete